MQNQKIYVIIKIESRVDQNLFHIIFLSFGRGFPLIGPCFFKENNHKMEKIYCETGGNGRPPSSRQE